MSELKEKIGELIAEHKEELALHGIRLEFSRKYVETEVEERHNGRSALLGAIDRTLDKKREEKMGYNYERNKYHIVTLAVIPIDKKLLLAVWGITELVGVI